MFYAVIAVIALAVVLAIYVETKPAPRSDSSYAVRAARSAEIQEALDYSLAGRKIWYFGRWLVALAAVAYPVFLGYKFAIHRYNRDAPNDNGLHSLKTLRAHGYTVVVDPNRAPGPAMIIHTGTLLTRFLTAIGVMRQRAPMVDAYISDSPLQAPTTAGAIQAQMVAGATRHPADIRYNIKGGPENFGKSASSALPPAEPALPQVETVPEEHITRLLQAHGVHDDPFVDVWNDVRLSSEVENDPTWQ